jgi:hypothetical protein
MKSKSPLLLFLVASAVLPPPETVLVAADITVENDLIKPEDVYNFTYSTDSDVWWRTVNATKYYCVFRSHWTSEDHPNEYPRNARWSDVILYSTNKEYRPWLLNRATTLGVEKVAEVRPRKRTKQGFRPPEPA